MPFDMGFNFRATAGYVTDGPEGVPVIQDAYPHTYTNGNGHSLNGGWTATPDGIADRANTNDPRIAGINFKGNNGTPNIFQMDLSSGSAPGAGTYSVDLAFGDAGFGPHTIDFKVQDTSTVLIDGTNGGAGWSIAQNHYRDATLADVAATTTWTGITMSKTFATTLAKVVFGIDNVGENSTLAHFRLTRQDAAAGERVTLALAGMP